MDTPKNPIPDNQIVLPKNAYRLRILECEKKTSQKGRPMLALTMEICEHPKIAVQYKGERIEVDVNGLEVKSWAMCDKDGLDYSTGLSALSDALGDGKLSSPPEFASIDKNTFLGRTVFAICQSEQTEMKSETGEIIVNPNTGKPVLQMGRRLNQYLSASE